MKQQDKTPEAHGEYSSEGDQWAGLRDGFMFDVGSAYSYFEGVKDKRKAQGLQYPMAAVLTLCVLAKLSGENTPAGIADWVRYRAEWLGQSLGLKRRMVKKTGQIKMPCAGSYSRILSKGLDAENLEQVTQAFFGMQSVNSASIEVCIDGKKIRGTITAEKPNGEYLLAAYLPGAGVVLMQILIKAGEGELTVAPTLLKALDLQGKVVTGDAMFAQRNLSIQIVEAKGDYVWKVKGNQETLEADIARVFEPEPPAKPGFSLPKKDFRTASQTSTQHGRIETRTLTTSSLLTGYSNWPYLGQVFKYECIVIEKKTGNRTENICFGVTSLAPSKADPKRLLSIVRGHWRIENELHYRRDVCLNEDHCGLRLPNLAHVFAILNNWALGLFALSGGGNFSRAQRGFNAQPHRALNLLMRQIPTFE
jgi:predicted transposase YbfD/YdcC